MSEWKEYSLEDLAFYYNGKAFKPSDWKKEGVKIIRIEQLNNPDGFYDYYQGEFPEINKIENGDLIFSWSATLKVVIWKHGSAVLNQHLFKVIPKSLVEKMFLFFLLDFNMLKLGDTSHGSTMKHIKRGELEKYFVKIPGLSTQSKIARILSTADAVIEKTQAAIAKYKAIKQGMLHDLFTRGIDVKTGKLRPQYQDALELYKESKLGWIPKEWEVERLGDRAVIEYGKSQKQVVSLNGTIPVYGTGGLMEYATDYLFDGESILIGRKGTIDKPFYIEGKFWTVDTAYYLSHFTGSVKWLHAQLENYGLKRINEATGVPSINREQLYGIQFSFPKEKEQSEIVKRIIAIDNKIQTEQNYLHKLQQIKAGLMADLLSGKKEVIVDEEKLTETEN